MTPKEEPFYQHLARHAGLAPLWLERLRPLTNQSQEPLTSLLIKLGVLSEGRLTEELSRFAQAAVAPLPLPAAVASTGLSTPFLLANAICPYREADGSLRVAMANPLDPFAKQAIDFALGECALPSVAPRTAIEAAISQGIEQAAPSLEAEQLDNMRDLISDAPVVRAVQRLIAHAFDHRASDIHFEPVESGLKVRIRVDGMLQDHEVLGRAFSEAIVSRIKVMAQLDIAERRLPQDGRIRMSVHGRDTDLRVATTPTQHGEAMVLRILDRRDVSLDLDMLGITANAVRRLRRAITQPHGIVLVTGPTGSGKTTTLYSALRELNAPTRKILTIEDPIEYTLEGVNQVQVKPQIGLTVASALRSFLRQDPDVMLVGEIRDAETVNVAVQAALTGHLVLSTVHTNSAAGAMVRLLDMGAEPYLLASTVTAVVGQRLVRKLCEHCREPVEDVQGLMHSLQLLDAPFNAVAYRPKGCSQCRGTGYRGRSCIAEVLEVTEGIRQRILARDDEKALERIAVQEGMRTLRMESLEAAARGLTSFEEVMRVSREE